VRCVWEVHEPAPPQRNQTTCRTSVHRLLLPRVPDERRDRPSLQFHLHCEKADEGGITLAEPPAGDPNSVAVGQTSEPNAIRFVSSGVPQGPGSFPSLSFPGKVAVRADL